MEGRIALVPSYSVVSASMRPSKREPITERLSMPSPAPISPLEIVIGYVGAAATKSIALGLIILATASLFVPLRILHPGWMLGFLVLTAATFSLFGFIIGLWADSFQKLQVIPLLVITPLTFLGGAFYSINMLPEPWQTVSLFNPVVYLISGLRWAFYAYYPLHLAALWLIRIPMSKAGYLFF